MPLLVENWCLRDQEWFLVVSWKERSERWRHHKTSASLRKQEESKERRLPLVLSSEEDKDCVWERFGVTALEIHCLEKIYHWEDCKRRDTTSCYTEWSKEDEREDDDRDCSRIPERLPWLLQTTGNGGRRRGDQIFACEWHRVELVVGVTRGDDNVSLEWSCLKFPSLSSCLLHTSLSSSSL